MEQARRFKHLSLIEGKALPSILLFAIPIFIGNVVGVISGWVDGLLLGRFVSSDALAAASIGGSSISVASIFASAFPVGMSVLTAKYFGKKDQEGLKRNFASALSVNFWAAIALLILALALFVPILKGMNIDIGGEMFSLAKTYAFVSSFSLVGLLFYSFLVSYLRALGENKAPLIFIVVFSCVSVIADLILTVRLQLGIYGASFSPLIAYVVTDLVGFIALFRKHPEFKMKPKEFFPGEKEIKKHLSLSLPLALELSLVSIGGVFVQRAINSIGEEAILGLTVAGKITGVLGLYINGIANAIGPFLSQNIGDGQAKRGKDGMSQALLVASILSLLDCLIAYFLIVPVSNLFLGKVSDTTLGYTRMAIYFYFGTSSLTPVITIFRYALESAEAPYWNLAAGLAQLVSQLLFVLLFNQYMGDVAVVGSSFFSSILPFLIMGLGAVSMIYRNLSFKSNLKEELKKENDLYGKV